MQVGSVHSAHTANQISQSGKNLPQNYVNENEPAQKKSYVRELAETIDPRNMSRRESLEIANVLMRSGEGELSAAFLPIAPIHINADGTSTDLTGTPEGDAIWNERMDMVATLQSRIEFAKSQNAPTDLLENAAAFLDKMQNARNSPSIDTYT